MNTTYDEHNIFNIIKNVIKKNIYNTISYPAEAGIHLCEYLQILLC